MAKKISAKPAAKKAGKKLAAKASAKRSVKKSSAKKMAADMPVVQEQTSVSSVEAVPAEIVPVIPEVGSVEAPSEAPSDDTSDDISDDSTPSTAVEENAPVQAQTEEKPMADERKGVGKEYNASEFSQPATEVGAGSSKIYLYVGISVVVLAAIIGGLFLLGGAGKGTDSGLTGSTITAYCSDTDGGYNRFTKGVTQGTYYLDYSSGDFMDYCQEADENKLTEYYCKNDLVVYTTEPCPDDLTCKDGICA